MMDLLFTKFLDVKSPLGLTQNEKEMNAEYHSIGVDVYMPRPTMSFINQILAKNKNSTHQILSANITNGEIGSFNIQSESDKNLLFFSNGVYHIKGNINIPTGIGFIIPKKYYIDIRPKSSNFNNEYTSITGLIDENFTYGCTVQLSKLSSNDVIIQPNEKFAQIVLIKGTFINSLIEVEQNAWSDLDEVIRRRENRSGGLGHSGRF